MSEPKNSATRKDFSLNKSKLFQEFDAERQEIMRHKWLESEKTGKDIGFERALIDWVVNHRDKWRTSRKPRG